MELPDGKVRIIASKDLTHGEIRYEARRGVIFDGPFPIDCGITSSDLSLTTHMRTCVFIDGPDYATCLKYLFETWKPDETQHKAIGPKQLGIKDSPTGRTPTPPPIGY
jgi:hypothetical protein